MRLWRREPRPLEPPRSIVVFAPNLIGDTVMATPAFRAIAESYPDARRTIVIRPGVAPVLDGSPWFHGTILCDHKSRHPEQRTWRVIRRLRAMRPDVALLLPNSVRSALIAWAGGARRRVGFTRGDRGLLLTDRLRPPRDDRGRFVPTPIVESYLELARFIGCRATSAALQLFTTDADERAADAAGPRLGLNGRRVVCFNTGGAFGPAKNWPNAHFAALAKRLVASSDVHVLILCGPAERDNARAIVAMANDERVVSLADEPVSIGLSKACVRRSALLITTDSGPRHFAAAFGVPVITLFGPTHIAWTETSHPRALHLQLPVDCGPCQRPVCPAGHHRCMRELSPNTVFEAARLFLEPSGTMVA